MAIIGIWGDSIVYGEVDASGSGWATRLRGYLSEQAEKNNSEWHHTYARGVCGDTSRNLLERFAVEAKSIQPDIVVLAVGINDAAYMGSEADVLVPTGEFENNLRKLVIQAKSYTKKVILVGLTRVNEKLVQPYPYSSKGKSYANRTIEQYDKIIQKVALLENLPFASVSNLILEGDLEEGLHPNSVGHQKLFQHILSLVEKVLAQVERQGLDH
ncbi:MAG: hypothetical protein A3C93_02425 [Candidatus Lloydbacteria bacterium RIFCSPHIGHO2_02_FULL_54_17]|uniref:SGNH hydrolase-type esterase domain-containing protein n=1 Tax=Candidatus Lloydbacteria bacterium RIFCSPHIGHO2_02_FULL_54_17 TaxID=1798664 RepID=A0A1G2DG57_9BACT|nr:MAG: hypothetical protein A2762_04480 [Candidatus Lloydbacteria bacterium RIFCSPHIGHO2_01_FULL_54_11]OGZ11768.1 MAG: hypothetical protein A3C93_02425 [Candidatus Lloydbacteria bacterium RIFCSPHIGHO2_02_FULL_54_17]OGZ14297.1 MAG: hypothetical protein A2948_01760 [Candidatus Lloydbacteria bacterium RIFCSPLOWO2_01_FULL_54_18]OGZ16035.1 MAG: hypothetical protein A3H76_00720 [Candidatus Lloydbacteria bacterium RIFCSPLOWO2_02_FULL_54_12]